MNTQPIAGEEASAMKKCPPCWKALLRHRKLAMTIIAPLALLPLLLYVRTAQAKCAYVLLLLACYWNFEVMPLGITALLPVVLIPLLGIVPSRDLCPSYFKDSNMLFLGGLTLAVSVEVWDLHKRIALKVLLMCGVQPRWLLFGFMLPTFALSMWISNTATVSMMLPTAEAVLLELRRHFEANRRKMEAAEAVMPAELAASNSTAVLVDDAASESASSRGTWKQQPTGLQIELQRQQREEAATGRQIQTEEAEVSDSASSQQPTYQEHRLQLQTMEAQIDAEMEALSLPQLRATMKAFMADPKNAEFTKIARMLMLSVSYAAIMGGISTLTGTSPNVVMYGIVQDLFGSETPLNYSSWMFFAVPIAVVTLAISWVWLQISFLGCRGIATPMHLPKKDEEKVMKVLRNEYNKLGPVSYAEINVMILFTIAIGLLVAREPGAPGWGRAFIWPDPKTPSKPLSFMGDAQPLIICAILMFLLPSKNPFRRLQRCCRSRQRASAELAATAPEAPAADKKPKKPRTLLDWKAMQERVAWQIILMLGAGLALADTSKSSGLSDWASNQLLGFGVIPIAGLVFIVSFFTSLTTQVTFNSGTATLLLPIFASFAQRIRLNPLYLMVACAASCSYGLILPVSTPANVLVFHSGYLRTVDMTRTGVVMWLVCNTLVAIATITYATEIFRLKEFPAWAAAKNSTAG